MIGGNGGGPGGLNKPRATSAYGSSASRRNLPHSPQQHNHQLHSGSNNNFIVVQRMVDGSGSGVVSAHKNVIKNGGMADDDHGNGEEAEMLAVEDGGGTMPMNHL